MQNFYSLFFSLSLHSLQYPFSFLYIVLDLSQIQRMPKQDPGDGSPDVTKIDEIEFKWNQDIKQKKFCDTKHMLYLLQLALNMIRLRTIKKNQYFTSIGRRDCFIDHLDGVQIITNIVDWFNEDINENKFNGEVLYDSNAQMAHIISSIGGVTTAQAMEIYKKLRNEVVIELQEWEHPTKLKLQTYGYSTMSKREKVLEDCSSDEIIALLTYVNPDPRSWEWEDIPRGVFQQVKWEWCFKRSPPKPSHLQCDVLINGMEGAIEKGETDESKLKSIQRWEGLICDFFKGKPRTYQYHNGQFDIPHPDQSQCDKWQKIYQGTSPSELADKGELTEQKYQSYDGTKFMDTSQKELCQDMMNYLIHPSIKNIKNKPFNTKLRGGCNQILRELKRC